MRSFITNEGLISVDSFKIFPNEGTGNTIVKEGWLFRNQLIGYDYSLHCDTLSDSWSISIFSLLRNWIESQSIATCTGSLPQGGIGCGDCNSDPDGRESDLRLRATN